MAAVRLTGVGLVCCVLLLGGLVGCAHNRESAFASPDLEPLRLKKIYVVRSAADERGMNRIIAQELTTRGFDASTSFDPSPPKGTDAIVTYEDTWKWDLTTYLLELKIQLREAQTGRLLATASSYHTSVARLSPEAMTSEVLTNMFKAANKPQ